MSKTSLNGYSYGKNPTTDSPFWGEGGGGGAVIDDETTALNSTWSSSKISSELATKSNATDVYDKTEVDEALAYKADTDEVYDKTSVDMKLADKADKSDTYTKTQVDTALSGKADASTTYTKTEVNSELVTKADKSDTYTKAQVDTLIAGAGGGAAIDDTTTSTTSVWSSKKTSDELATKADASTTYTKTEVNAELAYKADWDEVYRKSQVDTALDAKADKSDTYTKAQVDNLIAGAGGGAAIDDTTTSSSSVWSSQKVSNELASKANASTTYTKTEVDTALASKADTSAVVAWDDLRTYYANRLSTRYTTNYGATTAFEDGKNYSSVGTITISIGEGEVYNDQLIDIPYNAMQSNGTIHAIGDVGKYRWKDTYLLQNNYMDAGDDEYYLLPVKMAFIGYQTSNGKHNPYLYILREKKLPREGHSSQSNAITVTSYITDWTEVTSGGGGGSAIPTNYSKIRANNVDIGYSNHDASNFVYGDVIDFNLSITIDGKTNTPHALVRYIDNQYIPQNSPPQEFTPVVLTDPACTVYVAANRIENSRSDLLVDLYLYYPSDYTVTSFTATHAHHREWGTQRIREGVYTESVDSSALTSLASGHKAAVELTISFTGDVRDYTYYALLNSAADNCIVNGHYFGNFVSCEALAPKNTVSGNQVQATYDAPDIKVALFNDNGSYYLGFILPQNIMGISSFHVSVLQSL